MDNGMTRKNVMVQVADAPVAVQGVNNLFAKGILVERMPYKYRDDWKDDFSAPRELEEITGAEQCEYDNFCSLLSKILRFCRDLTLENKKKTRRFDNESTFES